jgi:hypothetical protein
MALKDGEMKAISVLGTAVLSIAFVAPVLYLTEKAEAQKTKWDDMESIEASVAYSKAPQKQPQKEKTPPPVKHDEGVSHDDKKQPLAGCKADSECKADEHCKNGRCVPKQDTVAKVDPKNMFGSNSRKDDDDPGPEVPKPGDFNSSSFGFAQVTKGHPFWQKLALDIHNAWEIPSISDVKGAPAGCFHLTPDGKIADTKFKEKSGNDVLDDSVQRALDTVMKSRNDNPVAVPTELLGATTGWICFRFDPNKG